ncbi:MAG: hypothetical protein R6X14_00425 [bacterium]
MVVVPNSPQFQTLAEKFNKQYGGLFVREGRDFHDRFIVLDETEYYHLGASIKDAGNRGFMFSRIEEDHVVKAFRTEWGVAWENAREVVKP